MRIRRGYQPSPASGWLGSFLGSSIVDPVTITVDPDHAMIEFVILDSITLDQVSISVRDHFECIHFHLFELPTLTTSLLDVVVYRFVDGREVRKCGKFLSSLGRSCRRRRVQ